MTGVSTGDSPLSAVRPPGAYPRWEDHLPGLLAELGLPADGVIQIGAHAGQEIEALTRCRFRRLVMVEPNPDHFPALATALRLHHAAAGLPPPPGGHRPREIVRAAAGRVRGRTTLHITEYDQQASPLPPLPPMVVVREVAVDVIPVREIQHGCNVLVIDAQGAELDVLAGADLVSLDLAVIEGSTRARYRGGSTVRSIADHMRRRGWRPVARWPHARPDVVDVAWLAPRERRTPPTRTDG